MIVGEKEGGRETEALKKSNLSEQSAYNASKMMFYIDSKYCKCEKSG